MQRLYSYISRKRSSVCRKARNCRACHAGYDQFLSAIICLVERIYKYADSPRTTSISIVSPAKVDLWTLRGRENSELSTRSRASSTSQTKHPSSHWRKAHLFVKRQNH